MSKGNEVGIFGMGWVGRAMKELFPAALVCDPLHPELASMADINARCSVAFIAVPTPGNPDCSLDMSIVEGVVRDCTAPLIVIRSTLQPGTCDCLEETYGKNICMVPEYLGETVAHPLLDETQRKFLVIGGRPSNRRKLIELYQSVYNANVTIRQVSNLEAEVIKLSENRAIAFKVMQSHELFLACEAAGVDYYVIREAVYGDDPRFDLWFTFAKEGNLGFDSSKCLQKDVPAWAAWAESVGGSAEITEMLVKKSREYARSGEAPYTCDNRPSGEEV